MPSPPPSTRRPLTLPNGLRVELCSAPRLKRCAAALRVAAGSHDVAPDWPGLAHFLEHLFFLGTERFAAEQNLMAYVQRHGGQVNASTRERVTDFFFELPPPVFAQGLERLCDMLAYARMDVADQLREREVLHAEFIAWSRDDASRNQVKRLLPLSPEHPLRWFHAGNRFSLPVPRQAFQQALKEFYRRFYQAGQMTLSLAGPQPLDELQALARTYGGYFAQGSRAVQLNPPALMGSVGVQPIDEASHRSHLMFVCEGLPEGHPQAATFLCGWMNNAQPGGLVAQLRERGLAGSLKAQVTYAFAEQLLLEVEGVTSSEVASLLFSWLDFFKTHYRHLLSEYTLREQRRLEVSGALALARHYSDVTEEPGLSEQAVRALDALLETLTPQALLQPLAIQPAPDLGIEWQLPPPNPFLRPAAEQSALSASSPAFTLDKHLPVSGEVTVYLRWTLPTPQPKLAQMLADGLKPVMADAQQAGVIATFSAYGNHWQLKLSGLAQPVPAVLEKTLQLLANPDAHVLARYGQPNMDPAPIPIRQLLKTLPDHFLNSPSGPETDDLQRVWASARWAGFATGMSAVPGHALQWAPGKANVTPLYPSLLGSGGRWCSEPSDSSENAVLVFYPAPSQSIEDEAIWRLFAHLTQGPFYQRLRVELQLGYAVFSGFRQIAGQAGLLFGVQSPSASAGDLIAHIDAFLLKLPELVDNADLPTELATLADQTAIAAMEPHAAAEMLWQAHQGGHGDDYPKRLQHSFAHLAADVLSGVASRVALPGSSRLILSNCPYPRG